MAADTASTGNSKTGTNKNTEAWLMLLKFVVVNH